MTRMTRRGLLMSSTATAVAAGLKPFNAFAASYTPADLKNGTLTPLGGEAAANADGSIPAWTGGYSTLPAGYQSGDPRPLPAFLENDKPILSITAANVGQYKDQLCFGVLELFNRFPEYRVDVYTTHRTAIAPQYVYDFTFSNASSTQISADGNSITGAYGGTPFPIPTTGHHIIWNHLLAWKGTTIHCPSLAYVSTASGGLELASQTDEYYSFPYYYPDGESTFDGYYIKFVGRTIAPPYQAGGAALQYYPLNPTLQPARGWQYLAGQRRTREAPQLQYDTPNFFSDGVGNFDEYQVFIGPLDDYDFNLLEKKEMFIPYNMNKAWAASKDEQLLGHYFNPDFARWERHRVWVVEMTLKPGKRNVDSRRIIYVDEDTWNGVLCDIYDSTGALWKYIYSKPVALADIPCLLGSTDVILYDFHAGIYSTANMMDSTILKQWQPIPRLPSSFFTAGQLAALAGGE